MRHDSDAAAARRARGPLDRLRAAERAARQGLAPRPILATLGLVSVTALNMYGGSLTLISAVDSFRKVRPTLGLRIVTVGFTALLSLVGALAATKNFLGNFTTSCC